MIFYYSGTGNSRYAADTLGGILAEDILDIASAKPDEQYIDGETIGFVFPVYSWGVPPAVLAFIGKLPERFINEIKRRKMPVWGVMTCGDEVALAPEMFEKALNKWGLKAESIWSVTMPNNYVLLPGFDVDSKDLEKKKLDESYDRLFYIGTGIEYHRRTVNVVRGRMAWAKTKLIYPLFKRWGISPKKWHYTDACIGCGICANACPSCNIVMKDGFPSWGNNCSSCLACYHSCPRHAVEYSNATKRKGQYFFPFAKPLIQK